MSMAKIHTATPGAQFGFITYLKFLLGCSHYLEMWPISHSTDYGLFYKMMFSGSQ